MPAQLPYAPMKEIFERFHAACAEPKGELEHVNAFTLVVAVALSAQATDKGVNKATRELFRIADTPEKMLALGEEGVVEHVRTIGLFRNKAKNVIKLSRILVEEYGGDVPSSRAALQSLPGVGRKTANVVLNMWWGLPVQAVDTHIFRVGNRTGIAVGRDPLAVERAIEDNVPAEFQRHAHHWLILHGRYVCTARKPDCANCLIADLCGWEEKPLPEGEDGVEGAAMGGPARPKAPTTQRAAERGAKSGTAKSAGGRTPASAPKRGASTAAAIDKDT